MDSSKLDNMYTIPKPQEGWLCPVCSHVYAPHVTKCECCPVAPTMTTTITGLPNTTGVWPNTTIGSTVYCNCNRTKIHGAICPVHGNPFTYTTSQADGYTGTTSAWGQAYMCNHANENPNVCPCAAGCYCKSHTCKDKDWP